MQEGTSNSMGLKIEMGVKTELCVFDDRIYVGRRHLSEEAVIE
jgi:hypothetical protein